MNREARERLFSCLLLVTGSLLYFFANLQKVVVPGAVFNELQSRFGVEASAITWLGAGFMYAYAINQLVVGLLADRYCGARVMAAGAAFFCLGSLCSAWDGDFRVLLVSRILTGIGASAVYLSLIKMVTRIAGAFYTQMIGIIIIVGYSGSVVGGAPFVALIEHFGYMRCMLTIGGITLFFYLLFLANCAAATLPPVQREVSFKPADYAAAFRRRHNLCIWFTTGIGFGSFYVLQTLVGKKFLQDFAGMSPAGAGMVMSVSMVIAALNGFCQASLSRLLGNRRRIFLRFCGFGTLAADLLLLGAVCFDVRWWPAAAAGWILLAFSGNNSSMTVALQRETNEETRMGQVVSIGNCLSYLVIAVFGGIVGTLMEIFPPAVTDGVKIYGRGSYIVVFGALTLLGCVTAFLSTRLKESYGRNIADQVR